MPTQEDAFIGGTGSVTLGNVSAEKIFVDTISSDNGIKFTRINNEYYVKSPFQFYTRGSESFRIGNGRFGATQQVYGFRNNALESGVAKDILKFDRMVDSPVSIQGHWGINIEWCLDASTANDTQVLVGRTVVSACKIGSTKVADVQDEASAKTLTSSTLTGSWAFDTATGILSFTATSGLTAPTIRLFANIVAWPYDEYLYTSGRYSRMTLYGA